MADKHFSLSSMLRGLDTRGRSCLLRGPRRWLALSALLAYLPASSSRPARAQQPAIPPSRTDRHGLVNGGMQRFNIPNSSLDVALAAWERVTGRTVKVTIANDALAGFRSPGVHGVLNPEAALKAMLRDTGLAAEPAADGNFTVGIAHGSASVRVNAGAEPEIGLDRYPVSLLNTPQSVTTITQKTMQEQGITTLRDALRDAPGISLAAGEGGSQGDNLTIRGFTARNDIFLDGMRDFGSYYRDPFDYSQVDVLEGPSGVEFGRGSTGGVINQESKQPELRPFVEVQADGGTGATRRLTMDMNEPLSFLGTDDSLRLNLMGDEGGVAERDVTQNRRFGVAPALSFGLGTPNRLTADYFHLQENDIPDYGIPWYFNRPAPVVRHNYYGFHENYLRTDVNMFTLLAAHDFASWATLRNQFRLANSERNVQITEPQVNTATSGAITPSTPLNEIMVNRNQLAAYSNEGFLWDQLDATVHASFWGVRHVAVIGAEGGRETSDPRRPTYNVVTASGTTLNTVPTTNLLQPDEDQAFSGHAAPSSNVHLTSTSYAFYLLDTMDFGRKWEFAGGARFDRFLANEKSISYPTPVENAAGEITQGLPSTTYPQQLVRRPSWRGALIYKPTSNGSVYFDYGTSFDPSAEALSLTVGPAGSGTANLAPETNQSYEFGSKWELSHERLMLRGDLFRTTQNNTRESDPTNSLLYVLSGTQRVQGAEVETQGHITSQWQVLSSYTFMHSDVVQSQFYPQSVGYKLANVPDHLFNLWTTYQPESRFVVGAGTNFVASRTASSTAPLDPTTGLIKQVAGYWVFSAMAHYSAGEHLSLQANVFNLLNRNYIDEIHPGHIIPGAGVSGLFGLDFRF